MEERPFRYISLFSGVEAASVAWHPLGWEPVAFAEFDKFPSAVLAHHYPDVPNVGDVTKHDWKQYEGEVELVVGLPAGPGVRCFFGPCVGPIVGISIG